MSGHWLLLALSLSLSVAADDIALVRVGDAWSWFKGRREPSAPPEAWRRPDFLADGWGQGPSGFAFDPWGLQATVFYEAVRDYSSVYFRRAFSVETPTTIAWLTLRVDYDGGFAAYLNGVEVARRGLPGDPGSAIPYYAAAQPHTRGTPEEIDLSSFVDLLRPGTNVLAVQWHNSLPIPFAASFVPELRANFTRGPFLQSTTTNRQLIAWSTPVANTTVVEYGQTAALGQRYADTNLVTAHLAVLTNLTAATTYFYRVSSSVNGRTGASGLATFRTFKESGPISFMVTADVGLGSQDQQALAVVMRQEQPDLVVVAGDLVYPALTPGLLDGHFFSVYYPQMRTTPFFAAAGNHDVLLGVEAAFYDAFYLPTNSVALADHFAAFTQPESYYSFEHGEAHFAVLYAPLQSGRFALTNGAAQIAWLEADLAASRKAWKFLFLHMPIQTSGSHRGDDYNANGIADERELADLLLPLARRQGVQVIFSGHDHVFERFNPVAGVYTVVSGNGGGYLYSLTTLDPASAQFWRRYGCVKITVDREALELKALDENGAVFDRMFIQRALLPPEGHTAAWHSPVVAAGATDDGDGNLTGQTFDFTGVPIPALSGDFSNLGRAYVNYDHDTLYLGLEQTMIYGDNTIFLFLESPRQPGVSTLAGLGNGIVDPAGQGADGLDFLKNLSFTNFAPSLACILGDEFADGQFRSFSRVAVQQTPLSYPATFLQTNDILNTGQGVFRLDTGFSDVPGVRLQQFNRSPQTGPVYGEQNANFITVAIPFDQLGLRHGDRIKLGGVVGGSLFATNAPQAARFMDRGFLGKTLIGSGLGPVLLEGVEIQIGPDLDPDHDGLLTDQERQLGTDPSNPDSDGDGLPDGWEVRFGLDPLAPAGADGPNGDPDGDGFTNLQEFLTGTNPRDKASNLRLSVALLPTGVPRLAWPAVPGRKYEIQYALELGGPFVTATAGGFPRVALSATESYVDPEAGPKQIARRFYRVRLIP